MLHGPPRDYEHFGRSQDAHYDSMGTCGARDHCGDQGAARREGSSRTPASVVHCPFRRVQPYFSRDDNSGLGELGLSASISQEAGAGAWLNGC
jgi:hypothetical protein